MLHLACALLLLLLTYQYISQATYAPFIHPRDESSCNCIDGCSKRTLFNIIWGCVSTTIICAWAAIHPNIPPREGPFKATLRRFELMFWTIVAPEILPAWALNQRLAAMTVRDLYNKEKGYEKERCGIWKSLKRWFSLDEMKEAASQAWTLKHGHFLIMGGFHLVEPAEENSTSPEETTRTEQVEAASDDIVTVQPTSTPSVEGTNADAEKGLVPPGNKLKPKEGRVTILTLEMLEVLVKDPEIGIQVTEDEITQRSKGDGLSKAIFILQSSWFIVQCIARRVQGLSLTQLELTTLALASLNGITFILWWDKPLGAQTLVRVYLKRKLTDAERNVEGRGQSFRSTLIPDFRRILEGSAATIRDTLLCRSEENIIVAWLIRLPVAVVIFLLFPIIAFFISFFFTIIGMLDESTSFPADATHVSTFYAPNHRYPQYLHALLLIALGSIFGGIHCAGWDFSFPTPAEQKLWRVASLAVTVIPIAAFPLAAIASGIVMLLLVIVKSSSDDDPFMGGLTFGIAVLAYGSARLVLLGLAVALLRHLPQSAYITVDWTKFYPHIL